MQKTQVINLWGGPGISKSTTCAGLFHQMKTMSKEVEMVREFAKDAFAWKGVAIQPYHQIYILGNQIDREIPLYGKVDYLVTDSPIMLCGFYTEYYNKSASISKAVLETLDGVAGLATHHNFILKRRKAYNPKGRFETEEQARAIDDAIVSYLMKYEIPFTILDVNEEDKIPTILASVEAKKK